MKKIIFILLLLLVTMAKSQSNSEALKSPFGNDLWSEDDKRVHFFASYAISAATYLFLSKKNSKYNHLSAFQKRTITFTTTIALGLLKETLDATQKNKIFNKNDIMADLAGASAFQVSITIPLNLKKKKDTRLTMQ